MIKNKKGFGESLQHVDPRKDKEMKEKMKKGPIGNYLKE